jgi:molybdopterin synthase catalytic subunit
MTKCLVQTFKSFISIQNQDFSVEQELEKIKLSDTAGAIVSFVGLVRADAVEKEGDDKIQSITLEHYSGMCEKLIQEHISQAAKRWPLIAVNVVHRVGNLKIGEQIVLVAVSSQHRKAAFNAAEFIMDFLKNEAPFWKKQHTSTGEFWVEAKREDLEAFKNWSETLI